MEVTISAEVYATSPCENGVAGSFGHGEEGVAAEWTMHYIYSIKTEPAGLFFTKLK